MIELSFDAVSVLTARPGVEIQDWRGEIQREGGEKMRHRGQVTLNGWFIRPALAAAVVLISATVTSASVIPVEYLVDRPALRRTALASTTITFELHEDPACSAAIAVDSVAADSLLVVERLNQQKLKEGEKRRPLIALHHVFSVTSSGGDLYVRATGTGIDSSAAGECQAQHPLGTGAVGDPSATNELNSSLALNGTILELSDAGGTLSADLGTLVDDSDPDPLNELNSSLALSSTSLELTDPGGTLSVDLSSLVDDADADPTNELIQSVSLNGTVLEITDSGGTATVELGGLGNTSTTRSGSIPFPDAGAHFGVHDVSVSHSFAPGFSITPILNLTQYSPFGALASPAFLTSVAPGGFVAQFTLTNHVELFPDDCGCGPTFTSITTVNGRPAIGYYDSSAGDLKYVRANDATGTTWGTPIVVDATGDVGRYVSLAVVSGRPAMSYYDATNDQLKYVEANDADGASWTPSTRVVFRDYPVPSGKWTSLAEINGGPCISFVAGTTLKFVYPALYAPPTIIAFEAAASIDGAFGETSLSVVNGNPAIAYYYSRYVRYVRANDSVGTSWGTGVVVSPGGQSVSLAVVNGRPAMSYYRDPRYVENASDFGLAYHRADDVDGASWGGTPILVDGNGDVGNFNSLAIVDGVPAVAYHDSDAQRLRYVEARGADGTTWDSPLTVDEDGPVGEYASMIVVDGHPAISYVDAGRSAVRYAKSGPPPGSLNWMASVP